MGFGGGHSQINGLKGGPSPKKQREGGGHAKYSILVHVELT